MLLEILTLELYSALVTTLPLPSQPKIRFLRRSVFSAEAGSSSIFWLIFWKTLDEIVTVSSCTFCMTVTVTHLNVFTW